MNFTSPWLKKINSHPRRVVGIIIGLWLAWLAWLASQILFDRPWSEAEVTARRVEIDRQQYNQLLERLESYHRPSVPPKLNVSPFRPTPAGTRIN